MPYSLQTKPSIAISIPSLLANLLLDERCVSFLHLHHQTPLLGQTSDPLLHPKVQVELNF